MESFRQDIAELLEKANNALRTADHMIYVTFPLIKEKRLLVKILDEIYESIKNILNAILLQENFAGRITLNKDTKTNFIIFGEKCAPRYNISQEELSEIIEISRLIEQHKKSPLEFVRKDKFVIMSENLHTETITLDKLKDWLFIAKDIFRKAELGIKSQKL